jgi:hypothetical protein
MNCCDYDCNQGRNCPARATPIKGVSPGTIEGFWPAVFKKRKRADPDNSNIWRDLVIKHTKGGACNFQSAANEFAALAIAVEREACAKVCEEFDFRFQDDSAGSLQDAAMAIRARGNT